MSITLPLPCGQARGESDPDPVMAARICEQAGANSIVAHLRGKIRRHMQDRDIVLLRKTVEDPYSDLEMSIRCRLL